MPSRPALAFPAVLLLAALAVAAEPADAGAAPPRSRYGESGQPLSIARLGEFHAASLGAYEPMYFLWGAEAPAAKFQVGFRYRLVTDDGWLAPRFPLLRGLFLAYTQRSLWDIGGESSPFLDTSYMPEVGWAFPPRGACRRGPVSWLGWQAALQHESNGRGGPDSRSLNCLFLRPAFAVGDPEGWHLLVSPRVFPWLSLERENADLADYRGRVELRAVFGRRDRPALAATGRLGRSLDRGSLQLDVTLPTRLFSADTASFLQVQYWTGYGESLLGYDRRGDSLRAGLALVR